MDCRRNAPENRRVHDMIWRYIYPTLQKTRRYTKENKAFSLFAYWWAQNIKSSDENSQTVKKIDADTGSLSRPPLENTVGEVWSIFEFLMPGFLGNHLLYPSFETDYEENDAGALAHLRQKVECFMLRRTSEVLKELLKDKGGHSPRRMPECLYQEILARVKKDIFSIRSSKGYEKSHIHILAGLTKLRQVCNHPVLLLKDKVPQIWIPKLELLTALKK